VRTLTLAITAATMTLMMMIPQIINQDVYINKEYTLCFSLQFNFEQYVIYYDSDMFSNVIVTVFSTPFRVDELAVFFTSSPPDAKF
jgi:hypothetical protein